jgi:formylglycine-generating enzyme required for sulfatase activity
VHPQCFDQPFWIDQYEVTNARYGSAGYFEGDNRPRESVDWFAAAEHCAVRGARLPTEAEWEYAARGPSAWVYPWGNDFVDANAVSSWENTVRRTAPVGSRPGGASWVGALDISGNVWDWTSTLYAEYPYDSDDGREDARRQRIRACARRFSLFHIIADVRFHLPLFPLTRTPQTRTSASVASGRINLPLWSSNGVKRLKSGQIDGSGQWRSRSNR